MQRVGTLVLNTVGSGFSSYWEFPFIEHDYWWSGYLQRQSRGRRRGQRHGRRLRRTCCVWLLELLRTASDINPGDTFYIKVSSLFGLSWLLHPPRPRLITAISRGFLSPPSSPPTPFLQGLGNHLPISLWPKKEKKKTKFIL